MVGGRPGLSEVGVPRVIAGVDVGKLPPPVQRLGLRIMVAWLEEELVNSLSGMLQKLATSSLDSAC